MAVNVQQVVQACSGPVAPATMASIIATESGGYPWAIYVNGMGPSGSMRFPTKQSAIAAAIHYIRAGYKVDMGLAQIDSENLGRLGLSVQQAFDPCTNVRAGATIMAGAYVQAIKAGYAPGVDALTHGFEAYNSGSTSGDYSYAQRVWAHAGVRLPDYVSGNTRQALPVRYVIPESASGAKLPPSPFTAGLTAIAAYPAPPVIQPVDGTGRQGSVVTNWRHIVIKMTP
jgi:type IV secretion system protein VirB1